MASQNAGVIRLGMTSIVSVSTEKDVERFILFPYHKYRFVSNWVAPLRDSQKASLNKDLNPFFKHAKSQFFLAIRDDEITGRIAVFDHEGHNLRHHDNALFFGLFEADTQETAGLLLQRLEQEAKHLGRGRIWGPMTPDFLSQSGFLLEPSERPALYLTPQNPPSYPGFLETAGFSKLKDFRSFLCDTRLSANYQQEILEGFSLRHLVMRDYAQEMTRLFSFFNQAYEDYWGFVSQTPEDIAYLSASLKPFLDPRMVLLIEKQGVLVGAILALVDAHQAFIKLSSGRRFPLGFWKLIDVKRHAHQLVVPMLAIAKAERKQGLERWLIAELQKRAQSYRYDFIEYVGIIEDHKTMPEVFSSLGSKAFKTYRLYQKNLLKPLRLS